MITKPEALRLADFIGSEMPVPNWAKYEAAAELRRLHEVNAELVEALQLLFVCYNDPRSISYGEQEKIHKTVRAAIAKATGEQYEN